MAEIFRDTSSRLRKAFLAGRTESQLSPAEKSVLKAMTRYTLLNPPENTRCRRYCQSGGLAAAYPGVGVCLCPNFEDMPEEFLRFVLAHELAHFGDICEFDETKMDPGQHPLESPSGKAVSVLQCLENVGIAGRKEGDNKILAQRMGLVDGLSQDGPEKGHVHCYRGLGNSHLREAGADVLALATIDDFLQDHPFDRSEPANLVRVLGPMIILGCRTTDEAAKKRHQQLVIPL